MVEVIIRGLGIGWVLVYMRRLLEVFLVFYLSFFRRQGVNFWLQFLVFMELCGVLCRVEGGFCWDLEGLGFFEKFFFFSFCSFCVQSSFVMGFVVFSVLRFWVVFFSGVRFGKQVVEAWFFQVQGIRELFIFLF